MIAATISMITIFSVGIVLSDGHRGYTAMYDRIYSDVVADSHVARRVFDSVIRKSSSQGFSIDSGGQWVEVCHYADDSSTSLDRYAKFYVSDGDLLVEYGQLGPKTTLSVEVICNDVSSCAFRYNGRSVRMILTVNDDSQELTTVTSAVMHN